MGYDTDMLPVLKRFGDMMGGVKLNVRYHSEGVESS